MSEFEPAPADPTQQPAMAPSGSDEHAEQPEDAADARTVAGTESPDADPSATNAAAGGAGAEAPAALATETSGTAAADTSSAADHVTGDHDTGDRADGVRTGHPASDAVLESLDGLDQRPVHEHVAVFEKAHEDLRSALTQAHGDAAS